ncbi:hypothetical protein ACO0QE_001997 [Hanseniaspora vineae]
MAQTSNNLAQATCYFVQFSQKVMQASTKFIQASLQIAHEQDSQMASANSDPKTSTVHTSDPLSTPKDPLLVTSTSSISPILTSTPSTSVISTVAELDNLKNSYYRDVIIQHFPIHL